MLVAPILNVPEPKQHVVHYGVDPSLMQPAVCKSNSKRFLEARSENRPVVLAVSSVAPHKNYETLIRAIGLLPDDLKDEVLLTIVGSTQDSIYNDLLKLVRDLGIGENVWFLGEVKHRTLGAFYGSASVFVQPARKETFGMTLLEAMAFGIPVICSTAGPFPEIAGDAALYFHPEDVERLASLITKVIMNPTSATERVSLGLRRAQQFSWQKTAEKTRKIFEHCVREGKQ
jgi:glycosyltransferase involved in cell wall biosynthesis